MSSDNLSRTNIRATALKQFWGSSYSKSIYLWEGSKHNLTLDAIVQNNTPTLDDKFFDHQSVHSAFQETKALYLKFVPLLGKQLNAIHQLNLPDSFWMTAMGYWFYRHICIVYDKYKILEDIDIDQTDIRLLEKDSFYVPDNHYDYLFCFASDFGVQQLVSLYYELFSKKGFQAVPCNFSIDENTKKLLLENSFATNHKSYRKRINEAIWNVQQAVQRQFLQDKGNVDFDVALCRIAITSDILNELSMLSNKQIQSIELPAVKLAQNKLNLRRRQQLLDIKTEDNLEKFLVQSLYCCTPKSLVEFFPFYFKVFGTYLEKTKIKKLVSEFWISEFPTSIFCAIAQNKGVFFASIEHGASMGYYPDNIIWTETVAADEYLTIGWKDSNKKIISGGFICKQTSQYEFSLKNNVILYVGRTKTAYNFEFGCPNMGNRTFVAEMKLIDDFLTSIPKSLRKHLLFRPRRERFFWDTETCLDLKRRNVKIDNSISFSERIVSARIVIINHLSTGFAELVVRKVPFLLHYNPDLIPLKKKYKKLFDNLERAGIMHQNSESLNRQLLTIYDHVQDWWLSEKVQKAVEELSLETIGSPDQTVNYLLSLYENPKPNS